MGDRVPAGTLLIAAGLVLVVAGLFWRQRTVAQRRAAIAAALRSADPTVRREGLRSVAVLGLAPWVDVLLALVEKVSADDPSGEADVAWAVAATQWEPADDSRIVRLRAWALDYHRLHASPSPAPTQARVAPPAQASVRPPAPAAPAGQAPPDPPDPPGPPEVAAPVLTGFVASGQAPADDSLLLAVWGTDRLEELLGERIVRAAFRPAGRRAAR